MKQALILLALIGLFAGTARGDIVQGRVVDSETKEPLPEAQIKFVQNSDNGWWVMSMTADSVGCFSIFASYTTSLLSSSMMNPCFNTFFSGCRK